MIAEEVVTEQKTEKTLFEQFMEDPHMDSISPFGTDEERKERNKQANIAACGKHFPYTITPSGETKQIVLTCKYFRECEPCRFEKWEEIDKRIMRGQATTPLGERLLYDRINKSKKEAYCKKIYRHEGEYLSFPQPDDEFIIIHNFLDGSGNELWEVGYDENDEFNEDNGLDLNFFFILRDIPEGRKISGNLGRPREEDEEEGEGDGEEEEEETFPIKKPFLYKCNLTERDAHAAYRFALSETLNINVEDVHDLEQALFHRRDAMAEHIKDCVVGFTWSAVTKSEIAKWNANENNFSREKQNVQISTSKDIYTSRNSDISDGETKKVSNFDAVMSRVNRGDELDDIRQQAIDDFLRFHGT